MNKNPTNSTHNLQPGGWLGHTTIATRECSSRRRARVRRNIRLGIAAALWTLVALRVYFFCHN